MTDKQYRVLTAVGKDRPGLVERISTIIHRAGGNLEDSRMAILGGEFAAILLISGSESAVAQVAASSDQLSEELGLLVHFRSTAARGIPAANRPYLLRLSGVDRTGIVARVSTVLSASGINVAALESEVVHAPLTGTPMFYLRARLQVPVELGIQGLRDRLSLLADEENLDVLLEATTG